MRETDFIRQNKEKWQEFERLIGAENKDPEKLSDLFMEVTDDLSFSRTYYPNRSVRVYLNGIAQSVFQSIYRSKRSKVSPFKTFWISKLPDTLWKVRKAMMWSAIIFILSTIVGYVSSVHNEDFCAIIMGDGYVEMSESNVEKGDPFAVYKDEHVVEMFFGIAWNNIQICFMVFVLGLLAGVGSAWVMVSNGIMFGAFTHFFAARGLLAEFSTVVMLHGTLELSMIVLAGAAGLTLGGGILFPKSYHRLQSLVIAARRGVQLMIPCTVFLIITAFIETWVTRHTEAPFAIRLTLVLVSLAIVVGYFVIYPWWRHRNGLIQEDEDDQLQAQRDYNVTYDAVKSNGKIFTEVFAFYTVSLRQLARFAAIGGFAAAVGYYALFGIGVEWVADWDLLPGWLILFDVIWPWNEVGHLFSLDLEPLLFVPISLIGTLVFSGATHAFFKVKNDTERQPFKAMWAVNAFLAVTLLLAPWFINAHWGGASMLLAALIALFTYPLILTLYVTACTEDKMLFAAMGRTFELIKGSFGRKLGLFWVMLSVPWIALMSTTSILWVFIFQIVQTFWIESWMASETLAYLIFIGFAFFVMSLTFPLIVMGYHLFYYNILEISSAQHLRERIGQIRFRTKAYGLEKE